MIVVSENKLKVVIGSNLEQILVKSDQCTLFAFNSSISEVAWRTETLGLVEDSAALGVDTASVRF